MKLESQKIYKEDKIWLTITKWKLLYYQNSPKEDMKRQNSIKKKKCASNIIVKELIS